MRANSGAFMYTALSCAASGTATLRCTACSSGEVCEAQRLEKRASMRHSRCPERSKAARVLSKSAGPGRAALGPRPATRAQLFSPPTAGAGAARAPAAEREEALR